jgi:hypothetical protein
MNELKVGMQVLHSMFGQGTIRAISGDGPSAKITVDFAANVGQKKLLASVANLTQLGASSKAPVSCGAWYEVLEVAASPAAGRRIDWPRLEQRIRSGFQQPEFWNAVREKLRAAGAAPKVLDDISGHISVSIKINPFKLDIRIRHTEMLREPERILARAMYEIIRARELDDFQNFQERFEFGVQHQLVDADLIRLDEADLGALPDRAPKRAPARVDAKGYVKPARRRYDQY